MTSGVQGPNFRIAMSRDIHQQGCDRVHVPRHPIICMLRRVHAPPDELQWPRDIQKWDGATSTSAAPHFSHGAAIHAKLHQPKIRIREAGIPGSRDPDAGIRIREAGVRIPGSGSWARGPKPGTGLRAPGSEVPGRSPLPGAGLKGSGRFYEDVHGRPLESPGLAPGRPR